MLVLYLETFVVMVFMNASLSMICEALLCSVRPSIGEHNNIKPSVFLQCVVSESPHRDIVRDIKSSSMDINLGIDGSNFALMNS